MRESSGFAAVGSGAVVVVVVAATAVAAVVVGESVATCSPMAARSCSTTKSTSLSNMFDPLYLVSAAVGVDVDFGSSLPGVSCFLLFPETNREAADLFVPLPPPLALPPLSPGVDEVDDAPCCESSPFSVLILCDDDGVADDGEDGVTADDDDND